MTKDEAKAIVSGTVTEYIVAGKSLPNAITLYANNRDENGQEIKFHFNSDKLRGLAKEIGLNHVIG